MRARGAYCSIHKTWLPKKDFYQGSLKARESRCKKCNQAQRWKRRRDNTIGRLQWNLYQRERQKGGLYPSKPFIQSVLNQYHGKSVLSGTQDCLSIVRYYNDLPLHQYPWNAILVTTKEAKKLGKQGENEGKYSQFPPSIQSQMLENKDK